MGGSARTSRSGWAARSDRCAIDRTGTAGTSGSHRTHWSAGCAIGGCRTSGTAGCHWSGGSCWTAGRSLERTGADRSYWIARCDGTCWSERSDWGHWTNRSTGADRAAGLDGTVGCGSCWAGGSRWGRWRRGSHRCGWADWTGVAPGGTAGQVLAKIDATNYNTNWITPASGGAGLQYWHEVGPGGTLLPNTTNSSQDLGNFTNIINSVVSTNSQAYNGHFYSTLISGGTSTLTGLVTAQAGINVTGAPITVGTANEHLLYRPQLPSVHLESTDGYLLNAALMQVFFSTNSYYDGANWQRWNTSRLSTSFSVADQGFRYLTNPPGSGTVGWSVTALNCDPQGNLTMAGSVAAQQFVPAAKGTVLGSRAGNAALTSLLTVLVSYGLLTDGTTA